MEQGLCDKKFENEKKNIVKILPGPKGTAKNLTSEISAFHEIIGIDMIDQIVNFTNLYIEAKRDSVGYSRERDAKVTTRSEIMALLGLLYLIGTKKANHLNVLELWANDGTGLEITMQVMSYKRFLFLLRCLRFDDRRTREERKKTDKLAAIRETYEAFVKNCKNTYNIGEFMTIDEKLEAFRGRCSFIQYIPNKPAKYGIKMFILCDSKTYFTSDIDIYCGQQPDGPFKKQNTPSEIVNRLVSHVKGKNRNLTTDNWYTSIPLARSLLEDKITLIGTLKKNKREIPPQFLPQKDREVNTSVFGYQKDITLVSYVPKKNKSVILLSTMHDTGDIDVETNKPEIILDYNGTKGGVDTIDEMCESYSVKRITRRWPLIIFFSLLDIGGINAQILYYSNPSNSKIHRRQFLKNLAMSLMRPHLVERSEISHLPSDIKTSLAKYRKVQDEAKEPQRKRVGRCTICGRSKNVNTTVTCDNCGKFICKKHAIKSISCGNCDNSCESE